MGIMKMSGSCLQKSPIYKLVVRKKIGKCYQEVIFILRNASTCL